MALFAVEEPRRATGNHGGRTQWHKKYKRTSKIIQGCLSACVCLCVCIVVCVGIIAYSIDLCNRYVNLPTCFTRLIEFLQLLLHNNNTLSAIRALLQYARLLSLLQSCSFRTRKYPMETRNDQCNTEITDAIHYILQLNQDMILHIAWRHWFKPVSFVSEAASTSSANKDVWFRHSKLTLW